MPKKDKKSTHNNLEWLYDNKLDIKNRTVYVMGEIDTELCIQTIQSIKYLESLSSKPITIFINSYGGYIYDGLAVIDAMESCKCDIITIGTGPIMSMAALIFLKGDTRKLSKRATLMVHQGQTTIAGRTSDVVIETNELKRIKGICDEILAESSNGDIKWWGKKQKNGIVYIDAKQALELKMIHSIINSK